MKKSLVLIAAFLFAPLANAGGMSFKCGGYSFTVYGSDAPLEYSFMAGDKFSYDAYGKVTDIGNIRIKYDAYSKVVAIGNVHIKYDAYDKIKRIGDMNISYDAYGKMTGTDGSIRCQW